MLKKALVTLGLVGLFAVPAFAGPAVSVEKLGLGSTFDHGVHVTFSTDIAGLSVPISKKLDIGLNAGVFMRQNEENNWASWSVGPQANINFNRVFIAACYRPDQRRTEFVAGVKLF